MVVGEALYTKEQFLPVFEKRAADIINPDICAVGGITAMLEIAALAAPHAVAVSPHNFNSPIVGLAATVHLSALITNFTIAELFVNLLEPTWELARPGLSLRLGLGRPADGAGPRCRSRPGRAEATAIRQPARQRPTPLLGRVPAQVCGSQIIR